MIEHNIAQKIVEVCQRLHAKNMLAAADGNVSYRVNDEQIYITPTGINKAFMKISDIAVIDIRNRVLSGKPSGERLMHLEVFKQCPKAKCVVHAHPPHAIAWSVAHPQLQELPSECLSEVILAVGKIPFVTYARPGTQEMGENLKPFLPQYRTMILARHGALSWGESINEAYNGMERLEHSAQILQIAHTLGGLTNLSQEEVQALKEMRRQIGEKTL
ncbi:MAG: class II aldolase/adducin family protein [Oligoflexia bacterium]|nr:class II aldolase/adducin family protein [Oligoflexia bacterium]